MTQDTLNLLLVAWAALMTGAGAALAYGFRRSAKAVADKLKIQIPEGFNDWLGSAANDVVHAVDERVQQFLKGLVKEAPRSASEKKALGVELLKSITPPGVVLTDAQAEIAIDAAVNKQRSLAPPADPALGTVYKSINPPPAPAVPAEATGTP